MYEFWRPCLNYTLPSCCDLVLEVCIVVSTLYDFIEILYTCYISIIMCLNHSVTEVLFVALNNVCFHFVAQMSSTKLTLSVYI